MSGYNLTYNLPLFINLVVSLQFSKKKKIKKKKKEDEAVFLSWKQNIRVDFRYIYYTVYPIFIATSGIINKLREQFGSNIQ